VRLFEVVEEFAGLTGNENVYDLYTGIGSIALFIAKHCKQVVGIEEVSSAIQDAKENMERNGISNAIFYAGDVKDILTEEFAIQHGKPDILITDPPRAGMHPKVVDMLLKLQVPKIVYVSCNPATQARDLALLSEVYDVKKSQAVDMFPHTHHIENVALAKATQLKGKWNLYISTLEEFSTKKLIRQERINEFRKIYKDPADYYCLFVIEDLGSKFVFIPID